MHYKLYSRTIGDNPNKIIERLFLDVIGLIKKEFLGADIKYKFNIKMALEEEFWDMVDVCPKKDIDIEIILYDDEDIEENFFMPSNSMGFFAISDNDSDSGYNEKFQVYVKINEEYLLGLFESERNCEFNPSSDQYDADYLLSILSTITHELFHVIEFVEHGNGMTPAEVDNVGLLTNEVCYGINALSDVDKIFFLDNDMTLDEKYHILYDLMEERVENKSRNFFKNIEGKVIELDTFRKALDYIGENLSERISEDYKF